MKKRPTRKKLIETLNNLVKFSFSRPIRYIRFSTVNKYGVEDIESRFYVLNMDDLLSTLMDMSLTCRIARIQTDGLMPNLVSFLLLPTPDCTTNIDGEMMELVAKLNIKPNE